MGVGQLLQLAVGAVVVLAFLVAAVALNRWDRGQPAGLEEGDLHPPPPARRRTAGSAVACIILGVGFMGVGLFLLLLPMLVTIADGGRITATLDVDARRLVSLYLLTVGSTFCIVGGIFLAAWLRPH